MTTAVTDVPVDIRRLEQLIAVVEEGGFTRAAQRLHLSQQALSTSIRVLEREVGVPLLDRSGARVTALPAGEALVEDARMVRGAAQAALRRARRIGRNEPDLLRIGHTPAVTADEVLALLARVRRTRPDLVAEVNQRYPSELVPELSAGDLDVGLCRMAPQARGLAQVHLGDDRLRVAVRTGHLLAARTTVTLADLADQRVVVWGAPGSSGYTDLLLDLCRRAGFEPRTIAPPVQGTPPVTAVLHSDDVAFVTAPAGESAGAVVLDLEPPAFAPLCGVWSTLVTSVSRDDFLALVKPG